MRCYRIDRYDARGGLSKDLGVSPSMYPTLSPRERDNPSLLEDERQGFRTMSWHFAYEAIQG